MEQNNQQPKDSIKQAKQCLSLLIDKFIKNLNKMEYNLNLELLNFTQKEHKIKYKAYKLLTKINLIKSKVDKETDINYYFINKLLKYHHKIPNATSLENNKIMKELNHNHIYCLSQKTFESIPSFLPHILSLSSSLIDHFSEKNYLQIAKQISLVNSNNKIEKVYLFNTDWLNVIQNDIEKLFKDQKLIDTPPQVEELSMIVNVESNLNYFNYDNHWFDHQLLNQHKNEIKKLSNTTGSVINKVLKEEQNRHQGDMKIYKVLILLKEFAVLNKNHLLRAKLIRQFAFESQKDFQAKISSIIDPFLSIKNNHDVVLYRMKKNNKKETFNLINAFLSTSNEFIFQCPINRISTQKELNATTDKHLLIANITTIGDSINNFKLIIQDIYNMNKKELNQRYSQEDEKDNNTRNSNSNSNNNDNDASNYLLETDPNCHTNYQFPVIRKEELKISNTFSVLYSNQALGKIGLVNLGNTCYMNCVLQCLSNTIELTYYFVNDSIKCKKPNDILLAYNQLIKEMWLSYGTQIQPYNLKQAFGLQFPDFNDTRPHDAQEFLVNLLNYLQEELLLHYPRSSQGNQINNIIKDNEKEREKEKETIIQKLSREKYAIQKQKNDSIIHDLFFGQFYSSLICQTCQTEINVFESFNVLYLILPLEKRLISLTFCYFEESQPKISIFPVKIFRKTKLISLILLIKKKFPQVALDRIKVLPIPLKDEAFNDDIWEYYNHSNEMVFYEEFKEPGIYIFHSLDSKLKMDISFTKRRREQSVKDFISLFKKRSDFPIEDREKNIQLGLYHYNQRECHICNKYNDKNKKQPYCVLSNEMSIDYLSNLIPGHILLRIIIQPNAIPTTKKSHILTSISLQDCLDYYTSYDEISNWFCAKCKQKKTAVKIMKIAYPPQNLIIQLKRFSENNTDMKNEIMIKFPLNDLDIKKNCIEKRGYKYDLYGVIYHFGNMNYGHYTAKCFNIPQKCWFDYNDSFVSPADIGNIVTQDAYLLFYKRKN